MSQRRKRTGPLVLAGVLLLAAAGGGAGFLLLRESSDDAFLSAARKANVLEGLQSDTAALVKARRVCAGIERSGDLSGDEFDKLAVEAYCDEYATDFIVLETATVNGTFEVVDADEYTYSDEGDFCEGEGGYGDINSSTQVVVRNTLGDEVARTELGSGEISGITCSYHFEFEITEGEDKYVLSVGDRGETTYTFDEIQVGPTLSLG